MYAFAFQRDGFCTLLASTASDALRLATELLPDSVVTDVRLAGAEDGLGLTRGLRDSSATRDVPVVVLTGGVYQRDCHAAALAGCNVSIAKPCLPDTLSQVVSILIRQRGDAQSLRDVAS